MHARDFESRVRANDMIAIKVKYSDQIRSLRLKKSAESLLASLRSDVGHGFLKDARIIISCGVYANAFRHTYMYNLP